MAQDVDVRNRLTTTRDQDRNVRQDLSSCQQVVGRGETPADRIM